MSRDAAEISQTTALGIFGNSLMSRDAAEISQTTALGIFGNSLMSRSRASPTWFETIWTSGMVWKLLIVESFSQ
jgi:hypothetical protein